MPDKKGKYLCGPLVKNTKALDAKSVKLEQRMNDRAYQVQVINSHRLKYHLVLDDEREEDAEVIRDSHWNGQISYNQKDSEIAILREKIEADNTTRYLIREDRLYYISRRDEEAVCTLNTEGRDSGTVP